MTEEQARAILGEWILSDNTLHSLSAYLNWDKGDYATLDGDCFDADTLEAIAWWMRNKGVKI